MRRRAAVRSEVRQKSASIWAAVESQPRARKTEVPSAARKHSRVRPDISTDPSSGAQSEEWVRLQCVIGLNDIGPAIVLVAGLVGAVAHWV